MIGRRACLVGAAASVASCGAPRPAAAPAPTRTPTHPAYPFPIHTSYPTIAPLGDATYTRRRDRARELTRAAGADVLFATSGTASFAYLVGADFGRSERLVALVMPVDGSPVVLAPTFEVPRLRPRLRGLEVRGWAENDDPVHIIGEPLRGTKILVEPHTDYATAAALARAAAPATLVDGSRAFEELRAVKSDEEIARMRRAVEITEDAFAATFDRLEVGMLEKDVSRIAREEHVRRGGEGGYALVQFGANAALPHGGPTTAALRPESVVLLDGGCSFQGWQSDITRTRWFGRSPSPRFVGIYGLVHDAQTAAIAAVRPGVPAQGIDRAAREVIARGGFGAHFTHRLGHGIGMEGHEAVYMVEGNDRPLEAGLVFSVEPGVYLEGELGVRLEDQVACTRSGADVLSRRAQRL